MSVMTIFFRQLWTARKSYLTWAKNSFYSRMSSALKNKGNKAFLQGESKACERYYQKALKWLPDHPRILVNLGMIYLERKKHKDAGEVFEKAFAIDASCFEVMMELSKFYLLNQRFNQGFELMSKGIYYQFYHMGRGYIQTDNAHDMLQQRLKDLFVAKDNKAQCVGKRLLVCSVCGLGDSLMMFRFIPRIKQYYQFKTIKVLCDKSLIDIAKSIEGVDEVFSFDQPFSNDMFDYHCSTLGLPHLAQLEPFVMPPVPYIYPDAQKSLIWKDRLAALSGLKVGIVWAGNPELVHDSFRSIPLEKLKELFNTEGVSWISLQKGERSSQRLAFAHNIMDVEAELHTLADTAALISALDLVIGVDTCVMNLAGAMGKTAWLLNRYGSEWRWLIEGDVSPWYPSIQIFRQEHEGRWDDVVARIKKELAQFTERGDVARTARHWLDQGNLSFINNAFQDASVAYEKAIEITPNYAEAHINLANTYFLMDKLDQAIVHLDSAVALNDRIDETQLLRLKIMFRQGLFSEELHGLALALTQKHPDNVEPCIILADILKEKRAYAEAESYLQRAIAKDPYSAWAYNTYFHVLMVQNKFDEGFTALRNYLEKSHFWRSGQGGASDYDQRRLNWAKLNEETDFSSKRLLVWSEWGLGDSLLFMRYLSVFREHFHPKQLCIAIEKPLMTLFQAHESVDDVVELGALLEADSFDYHCSLLDLPVYSWYAAPRIPKQVPYISLPQSMIEKWAEVTHLSGCKVGIVWSGGQQNNVKDKIRSVGLDKLAPLFAISGISWVNLQKGASSEAWTDLGLSFFDRMPECHDMFDTAALIHHLDLVISVDTSVINLVGAMGQKGWVLNRYGSEWRWVAEQGNPAWYPTIDVFNQEDFGDWSLVIKEMAEKLAIYVQSKQKN